MAFFLFFDESGQDHHDSPYEVLAGVAIHDKDLWSPEPFFVHSDLTTGIQVVDFVAYIISWNFRIGKMNKPSREELNTYLELIKSLRYKTIRKIGMIEEYAIWSVIAV